MKRSAQKIQMTSLDDLFAGSKTVTTQKDGVQEIALSELHSFQNHPFHVFDDAKMAETVESIREHGVLVPGIARPRAEGGYEIVAGHRRKHASELAGKNTMPFFVKSLDDDEATIIMVDTNLQREDLLPSEKAFAYKMKLDAVKRQGKRTDLTSCQLGTKLRADAKLAESVGDSARTVQRFIRLTELITPLLDMVDGKKLAFNAAVELSYLKKEEQSTLLDVIGKEDTSPSLSQAQRLKKFSQDGKLSVDVMETVLTEEKESTPKITLHGAKLRKYFPSSYSPAQMESIIFDLLRKWKQEQGGL